MQDGVDRERINQAMDWLKEKTSEGEVTMEWLVTDEPDPVGHRRLMELLFAPHSEA